MFAEALENSADVGLIGLAVMGQNLALNMADHGYKVAIYNRTTATTEAFVTENPAGVFGSKGGGLVPSKELAAFVRSIARPRRILIMVKAGSPTDAVIAGLAPLVAPGDVIVDGGNALFSDTIRREKELADKGILFVGSGVSGGEEGARFGPSLMPGGTRTAYDLIAPVFGAIAAKVDPESGKPILGSKRGVPVEGGVPCTTYVGENGAGHYVKMVHNGIEYADMQLIAEAYQILRDVVGLESGAIADTFATWNTGKLDSFLIEITADILRHRDHKSGRPFVDVVLDAAGQKGTGKWTSSSALDLGVAAPTIAEAVFARGLSATKEERVAASKQLIARPSPLANRVVLTEHDVEVALYCAKICAYAQGFRLMASAAQEYGWKLDFGAIAEIFRGGCIIRAGFLQKITEAFRRSPELSNLLIDPFFRETFDESQAAFRNVVAAANLRGVPVPAFSSALAYFDGYRSERTSANLIQAQRDYFGAHTYERVDAKRGEFFHTDWLAEGRPEIQTKT